MSEQPGRRRSQGHVSQGLARRGPSQDCGMDFPGKGREGRFSGHGGLPLFSNVQLAQLAAVGIRCSVILEVGVG